MIYREVQGTRLPALGFGTWQLKGNICQSQVREALGVGYRHIDTARMYDNEEEVGQGIASAGIARGEIFLTSKIWSEHLRPDDLFREAEQSLKALQTDYLDLLLIHWPNPKIPLEETIGAMMKLRDAGKIRHLGVSNFPPSLFRRACDLAPVFTNQVEYHPLLGQERLIGLARERGAVITAYSPLAQGAVLQENGLMEIGERHGKNAAQVALRWLLQQDVLTAIPRSKSPEHLRSNFDIFDFELSGEELEEINSLPKNRRQANPAFAPNWNE